MEFRRVLFRSCAALAVFQHRLDDPEWLPLAQNLLESGANYRSAAAAVAAANFESVRFGTTCTDWLIRLFDDEDETVRHEASDCFRRMRTSDIASHAGLFDAYVAYRYFRSEEHTFELQSLMRISSAAIC